MSTLLILFQQGGGGGFLPTLIILAVIFTVVMSLINRFGKTSRVGDKKEDMEFLSGERILLESDPEGLILTTHRVRSETQSVGSSEVISIMLDELASCAITRSSYPILLVLAALAIVYGFVTTNNSRGSTDAMTSAVVVALIFVAAYFATRQQVIALASAGATIKRSTRGMSIQTAKRFIDKTELAKNERYLLGRKTQQSQAAP